MIKLLRKDMTKTEEKPELTESQLRAISVDPLTDRIVVAMAGSGKTTVLVEYYIALLNTGLKPDQIVAITFTEKAARSMRVKLIDRLVEDGNEDISTELHVAPISTIHSFFAQLVREHSLLLGLDPDWIVNDETMTDILIEESLNSVMLRWRDENRGEYDLLLRKLDWGGDPHSSFRWFWDNLKSRGLNPSDEELVPPVENLSDKSCNDLLKSLREFIDASRNKKKLNSTEQNRLELAYELEALAASCKFDQYSFSLAGTIRNYAAKGKISGNFAVDLRSEGKAVSLAIRDFAQTMLYVLGDEIRKIFHKLLIDFDREYKLRKKATVSLDFNDLEYYALILMKDFPHVRTRIKSRYKAFLIDEYQDTNPLQVKIINEIKPKDGFFAVGDPRQSIYGFRDADVRIMLKAIEDYRKSGKDVVELDENFRSRGKILDTVSTFFTDLEIDNFIPNQLFGRIKAGRKFQTGGDPDPVEVIVSLAENAAEARNIEVNAIAGRLCVLLNDGMPFEDRYGKMRNLQPEDCAILFRSKTYMQEYSRALEKVGIPNRVTTGKGFFNQREIMDIINYLELLYDPYNILTFVEVLRAPFYGISANGLFQVISQLTVHKDKSIYLKESFWENRSIQLEEDDLDRFRDFQKDFQQLLESCIGMGPSERILKVLDLTFFRGAVAQRNGGRRRLGNIGKLVDLADEWERDFPANNTGFIKRMKDLRFRETREPESPVESADNSVILMTMHASKGLEFPLVVIADTYGSIRSSLPGWIMGKDGQLLLKHRDPSAGQIELVEDLFYLQEKETQKISQKSDGNRLAYVALTRAMEKLIISISAGSYSGGFSDVLGKYFNIKELINPDFNAVTVGNVDVPIISGNELVDSPEIPYKKITKSSDSVDLQKLIENVNTWQKTVSGFEITNIVYSVSEFAAWLECPRLYEHRYEMGLGGIEWDIGTLEPDEPSDESLVVENTLLNGEDTGEVSAVGRGSLIHNMLYEMVLKPAKFELEKFLKSSLENDKAINIEKLTGIFEYFKDSEIYNALLHAEIKRLEEPLIFRLPSIQTAFRAIPDAAWQIDGGWHITDYKSGQFHDENDPRGRSYIEQVRMYAWGVQSVYGGQVLRGSLLFIDEKRELEVDLSEARMQDTIDKARQFLDDIRKKGFIAKPHEDCRKCHFHADCPAMMNGNKQVK